MTSSHWIQRSFRSVYEHLWSMQVETTRFMNKCGTLFSIAKKETSCSRGWLRLVIQSIFAVITTASFILIVLMAVKNPSASLNRPAETTRPPRCSGNSCIVKCNEAPYYGLYEEDILQAVTRAASKCDKVTLELNNPYFENHTMPSNWLSLMRSSIYKLSILSGNLHYLSPTAFMSQFAGYINILLLQDLHIYTWETNSLVGLSSLEELSIIGCQIDGFQTDSLRAVDDTLGILTITKSGYWNPTNVTGTGFEKLTVVNFSENEFNSILGRDSFAGLERCEILYLNSCGIVAIGAGAFDSLKSIQVIYLDFNLLVTVPPGLFDTILSLDNPRPRISLQENLWHCDCDSDDLRQLVTNNLLLVEGICTYPTSMNGKTFTELENLCVNETKYSTGKIINYNALSSAISDGLNDNKVYVNGKCRKKGGNHKSSDVMKKFTLISPQENSKCSLNITKTIDVSLLTTTLNNINKFDNRYWLKFSFYLRTKRLNAIHIGAAETEDYGILWFQSDCPEEVYCIDSMPTFLRIYNIDENSQLTFCPMGLSSGDIDSDSCIGYVMNDIDKKNGYQHLQSMVWIFTVLGCICFGASIVYGLIRMNPVLLKGSKRILFVKHKTVNALVLPPKVPLRNDLINDTAFDYRDKEIFTLFANEKLVPPKMNRMKSVRSNKSGSPSYISALQPSEEQLADWRISRHFNNDLSISSKSELSTLSWICDDTPYYSLAESDRTYESLK